MALGQAVKHAPSAFAFAALIALAACGTEEAPGQAKTVTPGATGVRVGEAVMLTVRVVDELGRFVAGAAVRVKPSYGVNVIPGPVRNTDASGVLHFGPYPADQEHDVAASPPTGRKELLPTEVWGTKPGEVTLTLATGFEATGKVVDAGGRPCPHAHVWLLNPGNSRPIGLADANGWFRTEPVAASGATLCALPGEPGVYPVYYATWEDMSEYIAAAGRVTVRRGQPAATITLSTPFD